MLSLQVTEGLGCAESWNHIIAIAPSAPWVVVTAYDVAFLPGQLAKLAEQYEADLQVCIVHRKRGLLCTSLSGVVARDSQQQTPGLQVGWVPVYATRLVAAARGPVQ